MNGRRWRRTDPSLPADLVEQLTSHLGRGRSAVRTAKAAARAAAAAAGPPDAPADGATADALVAARRRVGLAKHGLGERGPYWWDEPEAARLNRARTALADLDALDARS